MHFQSERLTSLLSPAPSQMLEECRCACGNLPQHVTSLSSFRHFLLVMCAELRKSEPQGTSNALWAWMAGRFDAPHFSNLTPHLQTYDLCSFFRIYLVFSRSFMQQLNPSGISNFTHLFISLALTVDTFTLVRPLTTSEAILSCSYCCYMLLSFFCRPAKCASFCL